MASICKKVVSPEIVEFQFVDGVNIVASLDNIPDEIVQRLAIHGLSQKIGDSYAGAESVDEAAALAQGVYDNLKAGVWAVRASRGGKIIEAIVRATNQPFEVVMEKWAAMDDAAKATIKKHPDVKKALAAIEAERAATLAEAAKDAPALEF